MTVLLLGAFGALFASADAAFAAVAADLLPDIGIATVIRWIFVFTVVGLGPLGAAYLLAAPPDLGAAGRAGAARVRRWEWAVPVGPLDLLFAGFVRCSWPCCSAAPPRAAARTGRTYAEYARSGFGQLVTVTVLTLVVMGVAGWLGAAEGPAGTLAAAGPARRARALSLVIVASALFRMHTYQEAYGFTRLRVLVSVVELWLGVVFLLVLAAGIRLRAGWLPRMVVATGVAAVLALAALNPDRFIAEQNIARWQAAAPGAETQLDLVYLRGLSADALPVLICLPAEDREFTVWKIESEVMDESGDWRSANLSRALARRLLSGAAPPSCGD